MDIHLYPWRTLTGLCTTNWYHPAAACIKAFEVDRYVEVRRLNYMNPRSMRVFSSIVSSPEATKSLSSLSEAKLF